jgi:hypothetical protein
MMNGVVELFTADMRAEAFLRWLGVDPRMLPHNKLESRYADWLAQEAEQYKREEESTVEES